MSGHRSRAISLFAAGLLFAAASWAAPQLVLPVLGGEDTDPSAIAVRFNKAELHALAPGAAVEFTMPNATRQAFRFERTIAHGGGIVSWVASGDRAGDSQRAVITTGPAGSWGWVQTPEGKYRIYPGEGHDWLAKPDTSLRWAGMMGGRDTVPGVPDDERLVAGRKGVPSLLDAALLPKSGLTAKAAPVPQAQVDVMLVYTKDLAQKLDAGLMPMLYNLVTSANQAFAASEVAITLRLVRASMVDYSNANGLLASVYALGGFTVSPSSPALAAEFAGVRSMRDAVGADLVALLRDGPTDGGGVAFLLSNPTPGVIAQSDAYSVIQYCASGCEEIFAHEIAHNMGSGHDRANVAFENGGIVPAGSGVYAYSFGHYDCAGGLSCSPFGAGNCGGNRPQCSAPVANDFGTIMSFIEPKAFKYSNPNLLCVPPGGAEPGRLCGAAGTADNALSLNNVRANVSAYRNQAVASLPGSLQFTDSAYAVAESAGSVSLTVSRIGGNAGAVSVQYALTSGTATAGPDFTAAAGTLSWPDGDSTPRNIIVPVSNDGIVEGVESFKATLSNPSGATGVYLGWPVEATALILEAWPPGGTFPAGFTSASASPWAVANDRSYDGDGASLKSGAIAFGANACDANGNPGSTNPCPSVLTWTGNLSAGTIAFAYRLSAFPAFGFLEFFIDGSLVLQATGADVAPDADTGWRIFSTPVAAGNRTLTWRYRAPLGFPCAIAVPFGGSVAPYPTCADRAWIDAVSLPAALAPATLGVGAYGNTTIALGQSVTLYGNLSAPVTSITGTITFKDGGIPIPGCIGLDIARTFSSPPVYTGATCTYTGAAPGGHAITVEYGGNAEVAAGASPNFLVTVVAIDPFPLSTSESVGFGALVTSDPVALTGFTGTLPISIVGGQYSKNCTGVFTTAPGTVQAGDTVCVRVVTPRADEAPQADLSVGGVISSFSPYPSRGVNDAQPAEIAAGIGHTLATSGGDVYGWGDSTGGKLGYYAYGSTSVPVYTGTGGFAVAAGLEHSLVIRAEYSGSSFVGGVVRSMGLNTDKQLGVPPGFTSDCAVPGPEGGNFPCLGSPVTVQGLDHVVAIGAGWRHSLALRSDGTVWAWGSGEWGQNGAARVAGLPVPREAPTLVPIAGTVVRISAGYMHNAALLSNGTVVAWGHGSFGELGPATLNESVPTPVPVTGLTDVVDIAAGAGYTLALRSDGSVVSWGVNAYGTLGDPLHPRRVGASPAFRQTPTVVPNLSSGVIQIAAGFSMAYALKNDGKIYAWGLNHRGQANRVPSTSLPHNCGTADSRNCILTPTLVPSGTPSVTGVTAIYAGGAHFVGSKNDGTLVMFGDNSAGQLASSGGNFRSPPFNRDAYDPDTIHNPAGVNGTPFSVGKASTSGGIDLDSLDAGIDLGSARATLDTNTLDLTLTNIGDGAMTIGSIAATGIDIPAEFGATDNCPDSPTTLPIGSTCTITLSFSPGDQSQRTGQLAIDTSKGGMTLPLSGTGISPLAPSTVVVSSPNGSSAPQGTVVSFVATVTSSAAVTGTVDFVYRLDGIGGTAPLPGCSTLQVAPPGQATVTATCQPTPVLAAGFYEVFAQYTGGPGVQPGSSFPAFTFTVQQVFHALTVSKTGAGSGTVTSVPAGINCGATCGGNFLSGTVLALTPAAATGSTFTGWTGACTGSAVPCNVTMDAAKSVVANFALQDFALGVTKVGSGAVNSSPAGIACGGTCNGTFPFGTSVTLTATASTGWTFTGWTGSGCSGTGTCVVSMDAAKSVTATFTAQDFTVGVSKSGSGSVTSSPAGIACGAACSAPFPFGSTVTLGATASAGWVFAGWSGAGCAGTGTCVLNIDGAKAVSATFTPLPPSTFPLSIAPAGTGAGTVTSQPAGIDCGTSCAAVFAANVQVTLTATPATGSDFAGWAGAGCSGTGTCVVTLDAAKDVTATFTLQSFTLGVTKTGSGKVTSNPAGIDCGSACAGAFAFGTIVSLTATPDAGWVFAGWGGACAGTAACQVTMEAAKSVTATFELPAGALSASPASLDFGGQSMNTTAPSRTMTLTNTGGSAVTIGTLTATAPFTVSHDCGTLAAGGSCTAMVTVKAGVEGAIGGTLAVSTSVGTPTYSLAVTGERSLVTHYYNAILRRPPDPSGKPFWEAERVRMQNLGANVNETWFAMATFFFFSAEYTAFNRNDAGFVTDLYRTFFNREPDAGGLSFWTGQIAAGVPREIILVSFMFSPEFQTFAQGIFGNTAARKEVDTVVDFYRGVLSRLPDNGGFNSWVSQFRTAQCSGASAVNTTVEAISSAFMNSGEYIGRNRTNAQFVGDIYNAFLRRGGEQDGVLFWIGELNRGVTRNSIRQQFIATPEFQGRVAAIIAQGCLQ